MPNATATTDLVKAMADLNAAIAAIEAAGAATGGKLGGYASAALAFAQLALVQVSYAEQYNATH